MRIMVWIWVLLILLASWAGSVDAASSQLVEIAAPTEARYKRATVSSSNAEVTRGIELEVASPSLVEPLALTVVVSGLPQSLEDSSLRLNVTSKSRGAQRRYDIDVVEQHLDLKLVPREASITYTEAHSVLRLIKTRLESESKTTAEKQINLQTKLVTIQNVVMSAASIVAASPDGVTKLFELHDEQTKAVTEALDTLSFRAVELAEALDDTKKAFALLQENGIISYLRLRIMLGLPGANEAIAADGSWEPLASFGVSAEVPMIELKKSTEEKTLTINFLVTAVESDKATKGKKSGDEEAGGGGASFTLLVDFGYFSSPAQWRPEYDLFVEKRSTDTPLSSSQTRASTSSDYLLRVAAYAAVEQATGEDWQNVLVALSSASPKDTRHYESAQRQIIREKPKEVPRVVQEAPEMVAGLYLDRNKETTVDMRLAFESTSAWEAWEANQMSASEAVSFGSLSSAVLFQVLRPVNVSSRVDDDRYDFLYRNPHHLTRRQDGQARLLIEEKTIAPILFTFAVPSRCEYSFSCATLQCWAANTGSSPLLHTKSARLFIDGAYTGKTVVDHRDAGGIQKGERLELELGQDQLLQIVAAPTVSKKSGKEEDKSTWFVRDKKSFRVKTIEWTFRVTSLHNESFLVVLSEGLPASSDVAIKIDLIEPSKPSSAFADGTSGEGDAGNSPLLGTGGDLDSQVIARMVEHASVNKPALSHALPAKFNAYFSAYTGNIYWVGWIGAGQSHLMPFKYNVTSPVEMTLEEPF